MLTLPYILDHPRTVRQKEGQTGKEERFIYPQRFERNSDLLSFLETIIIPSGSMASSLYSDFSCWDDPQVKIKQCYKTHSSIHQTRSHARANQRAGLERCVSTAIAYQKTIVRTSAHHFRLCKARQKEGQTGKEESLFFLNVSKEAQIC